MEEQRRGQLVLGGILIILGIGLLALQLMEGFGDAVILFLIGGLFVAGYLYRRAYGLLIPGCILLGLGLGKVGESTILAFGGFEQLGLGVGFVAIYVIDLVYTGASSWWPLIPGLILIVTGLAEGSATFERLISVGWPIIIIFIGLLSLAAAFGLTGRKKPVAVEVAEEPEIPEVAEEPGESFE
jgi:hypothetical protein